MYAPAGGKAISIHSLRMEGDLGEEAYDKLHEISIHSLRMEGDGRLRQMGGQI